MTDAMTTYTALFECGTTHAYEIDCKVEGHRLVPLSNDPDVLVCPECGDRPRWDRQLFQVTPFRRRHADTR